MNNEKMKVILDNGAYMPERGHNGDAGLDLRTPRWVEIPAHGYATIDTGVHMQIPYGYYGKLESKSGLNVKRSVVSLGGVIDFGYTGSIKVKLYNLSDVNYCFEPGEKIVQIIIQPCEYPEMELTDHFEGTERGDNGFGSTGR